MNVEEYNKRIDKINNMPKEELDALLRSGKCPMPVELLIDVPLGMFHCELCGTMVIAGIPHGPMDPPWDPNKSTRAKTWYKEHPELLNNDT